MSGRFAVSFQATGPAPRPPAALRDPAPHRSLIRQALGINGPAELPSVGVSLAFVAQIDTLVAGPTSGSVIG